MKKITTGIIAVGAGIALLAGSAGSIAYWQSQQTTGAVTFTTGDIGLDLEAERWWFNGVEVVAAPGSTVRQTLAANYRAVPGTTVAWRQNYFIDQNGTDLYLELDVALGGIQANAANPAAPASSSFVPSYTLTSDSSGLTLTRVGASNIYTVTGRGEFHIDVTLAWPLGATADATNALEEKQIDFTNTTVTLKQVAAPAVEPPV